jgi:hypothetical protein
MWKWRGELHKDAVCNSIYLIQSNITKEALERFGNIKRGIQVIRSVKYADELVLLAKEETVLQGVTDGLTETVRCYWIEMSVWKNYGKKNHKAIIQINYTDKR